MSATSSPTQENRRVAVQTSLGKDAVLFYRMTATEHMGRLFQFEMEVLSTDYELKPKDILGTNATVRLETGDDTNPRYFNGFVVKFAHAGRTGRYAVYQMSLRPWLWFLTRTSDCRIFQNKKVPAIIEKIFGDLGFSDFDKSGIKGNHPTREYVVQYRETDFNFASRLMEEEGIYYWFKHENGKHTLMLTDDFSTHKDIKGCEKVYFHTEAPDDVVDHMTDWHWSQQVQPGKYASQDYNFETLDDLKTKESLPGEHAHANYEIYDYPGLYKVKGDGDSLAKSRIEEQHCQHEIARGAGHVRGLYVGGLFKFQGYWRADQNTSWLVVSATDEVLSDEYVSTGAGSPDRLHSNTISVIPSTVQFRSPRITPKPVIQGPQTAVVCGKSGEEIWPDKYGRVKVQFHWDREGKADENTTCFIRHTEDWAGKKWGTIRIPRVGHEVLVEFLEGDPDRPVITGELYHKDNMPPYTLPDHKTRSGVKSNSSKGGGGFNEIRFEDKKGKEQIFVHAERNQDIRVKADRFEAIGHDRHLFVKNDKFEHVENVRHELVEADHFENIKGARTVKVELDEGLHTLGHRGLEVDKDHAIYTGGKRSDQSAGNFSIESTGGNVVIEAASNITLRAGGSVISIDSGGVKIDGASGDIMATALNITADASAQATLNSTAGTTVSSSASTTISGSAVMIN